MFLDVVNMSRSRSWCFTWNNPTNDLRFDESVKYAIWQEEEGESGTRHFQGYIEYPNAVGMRRVKNTIAPECHVEIRRGTRDQARAYCCKPESRLRGPWEHGVWIPQGDRSDLRTVAESIREDGLSLTIEEYPDKYIRYHTGMHRLAEHLARNVREQRSVVTYAFWGPAGCGKTRLCYDMFPNCFKITRDADQLWWDGYMGEEVLLLDDFYGWIRWHFFLSVLDRYPLRLPIKGGHTYANWKVVLITSNKPPEQWYEHGMKPELKRRLTNSYDMNFISFLAHKLRGVILSPATDDRPCGPPM